MLNDPQGGRGFYGAAGFNGDIMVAQNHGFRAFRYDASDNTLRSLVFDYEWTSEVNRAVCAVAQAWDKPARDCPFPNKLCSHGFYAYYDEDYYPVDVDVDDIVISGVVNGYGRCVIGSKGYRSEYASLVALIRPDRAPTVVLNAWQTDEAGAIALMCAELERRFPTVPLFDTAEELRKVISLPGRPPRNSFDE